MRRWHHSGAIGGLSSNGGSLASEVGSCGAVSCEVSSLLVSHED